jgi:DMSO reductase anchor subunit
MQRAAGSETVPARAWVRDTWVPGMRSSRKRQAAASPSMEAPVPRRLFDSLSRVRASSYILIGVILCSLIASTINYLVFQDPFERFFLLVSVALTLFGTIVTRRHFFGLHNHEALLQAIDPSLYVRQ